MEDVSAIDNARFWLDAAKLTLSRGIDTVSIYDAEMSVEIALKGVMDALGTDVQKTHDIVRQARKIIDDNRTKLPKDFLDREQFILDTMGRLSDLRPKVGYVHEGSIDKKSLKTEAKEYVGRAEEIVALCDKAIRHIRKA